MNLIVWGLIIFVTKTTEITLKMLEFCKFKGKQILIMFSERDPSKRRSGRGIVVVNNLDKSINNKKLCDLFSYLLQSGS